ncbi:AAA family ATPase [Leptolyngbya sp. 15MV]|nr:AAA family ATPase [Leptolyngbya sp. 15MV]
MCRLRTVLHDIDFAQRQIPYDTLARLEVSMDDFLDAWAEIEPSAVREVFVEVPRVEWDQVGGHQQTKRELIEALEWPLLHARVFEQAGVRPPKGILMVGPPGVGKPLLARAAATQGHANFISVKGPELLSKFVGESERAVREVFRKARQAAPCVVFFDEIDAILPARAGGDHTPGTRVMSQFLAEMDGVEDLRGVLVLGATNRIDMLDPAVLRPGRFDRIVRIPPPDRADRQDIFRVQLRGKPLAEEPDLALLAEMTAGRSGADIAGICARAAMRAVRRTVDALGSAPDATPTITTDDLIEACRELREDHAQ